MMAVDRPGRCGFLYDEVYFITMWAGAGGQELVDLLRTDSYGVDRPDFVINPDTEEPNPESLLALVLEHGVPIDKVRDLI